MFNFVTLYSDTDASVESPIDTSIVDSIIEMGFPSAACKLGASLTRRNGLEAAAQ